MNRTTYVINLRCPDRPGIVAAVTTVLASLGGNIAESAQFWDRASNAFFMRVQVSLPEAVMQAEIEAALAAPIERFGMTLAVADQARTPRLVIMVSRFDHALLHLLYQIKVGWLRADVAAVVSNHPDFATSAEREGVAFHHWPVTAAGKAAQEKRLLDLVGAAGADLVVLARYMQILSDETAGSLSGRAINIHHSFLPGFKGANPYKQAHARGVKLIGATAHYVSAELDEGPIIEQETERVSHARTSDDFVAIGRDIESRVLARAVKLHCEGRVMLNGRRTVVFAP